MTGATAVPLRDPAEQQVLPPLRTGKLQPRSPSPVEEEEEPWDQQQSDSKIRSYQEDPDMSLDDGELPSLTPKSNAVSSKPIGGRMVNGRMTVARALSPPSRAGLDPPKAENRGFWSQLDPDEDEEEYNDGEEYDEQEEDRDFDEDGPDDELAARQAAASRRRDRRELQRKDSDSEEEYDDSVGGAQTFESGEDMDNTYCGQTLNAIGEMCAGLATTDSTDNRLGSTVQALPPSKTVKAPGKSESQEENTAIEVEFVEQTQGMTAEKKNAYLSSMAKKAKEEFEVKKKEGQLGDDPNRPAESASVPSVPQSYSQDADTYKTFSKTEKRKFVRLINSGISPAVATQRVVEEREAAKAKELAKQEAKRAKSPMSPKSPKEQRSSPKRAQSPGSPGKTKGPRLAFWRKGSKAANSEPGDEQVFQGQTYSKSMDEDDTKEEEARGAALPVNGQQETPAPAADADDIVEPPAIVAKGGLTSTAPMVDTTPAAKDESEERRTLEDTQFAPSGINYYDAVRREEEEEEEEEEVSTAASRQQNRLARAKLPKFAVLKERRAKTTSRSQPPTSASKPSFPGAPQKEVESKTTFVPRTADNNSKPRVAVADVSELEMIEEELLRPLTSKVASAEPKSTQPSPIVPVVPPLRPISPASISKSSHGAPSSASPLSAPVATKASPQGRGKSVPITVGTAKMQDESTPISPLASTPKEAAISPLASTPRDSSAQEAPMSATTPANRKVSPKKVRSAPPKIEAEVGSALEISMDTYFNATEEYSTAGGGPNDAVSVYTSGTAATGASNYTTSTRSRRPGAARSRLARARQVVSATKKGWHESIRAAAASNNRVWDPKRGWVDYQDPQTEVVESKPAEKIHIDLNRSLHKDVGDDVEPTSEPGEPVPVPFPPEWEKQRQEMLAGQTSIDGQKDVPKSNNAIQRSPPAPEALEGSDEEKKTEVAGEDSVLSSPMPKGWVESMKAASAALEKNGQKWDPVRGWTRVDDDQPITPNIVDFDHESSAESPIATSRDGALAPGVVNKDVSTPHDPDAGQESVHGVEENRLQSADEAPQTEPRLLVLPRPPKDSPKKLNSFIAKSGPVVTGQTAVSTEGTDTAVASAAGAFDPYVGDASAPSTTQEVHPEESVAATALQIDGTKKQMPPPPPPPSSENQGVATTSVADSSTLQSTPISEDAADRATSTQAQQDSRDHDLDNRGAFPSVDDRPLSPTVDIVKEKVGAEDMGLFSASQPEPKSSSLKSGSPTRPLKTPTSDNAQDSDLRSRSGLSVQTNTTSSTRRGRGPVDMDEVDDDWDSDDEQRYSTAWEPSDRSAASKSGATSVSVGSQFSKKVPKLRKSPRDTSPVSVRKSHRDASDEQVPGTDSGRSEASETKSRVDSVAEPVHGASPIVSPESPGVKERLQRWEELARSNSEDADEVSAKKVGSLANVSSNASSEWKSFMGKKVRAESEAAEMHRTPGLSQEALDIEERRRFAREFVESRRRSAGPTRGVVEETAAESKRSSGAQSRAAAEGNGDEDSLFDFEARGPPGLDISDLSPIHAKDENSDFEEMEGSEAYGPEPGEPRSFFQRLSECAAPIMPAKKDSSGDDSGMPAAHLAFLRANPQSSGSKPTSRFIPPALCGRPDVIIEEDDTEETIPAAKSPSQRRARGVEVGDEKPEVGNRSVGSSKAKGIDTRGSGGSTISGDFGAKTAYLEALAMKTAVASPRSSSRRRERSSGGSTISSSSVKSEKWKDFLERKRATEASPNTSRSDGGTDVSKAAERYASEKVEEMMTMMAARSQSTPGDVNYRELDGMLNASGDSSSVDMTRIRSDGTAAAHSRQKAPSVLAAEDLAAARVEAMMAALSNSQLDEDEEGEI